MARNYVMLDDLVNQYLVQRDDDDLDKNMRPIQLRNIALMGFRELELDVSRNIKSVKLEINKNLDIVTLPSDYLTWTRIGVIDENNNVFNLSQNKKLNIASSYLLDSNDQPLLDSDGVELLDDMPKRNTKNNFNDFWYYYNYYHRGNLGVMYGIGGHNIVGEFRINRDSNRIELTNLPAFDYLVLEYIYDASLNVNQPVPIECEQAILSYIYYKAIERKINVPMAAKYDARQQYLTEKKKARRRLNSVRKQDLVDMERINTSQTIKLG